MNEPTTAAETSFDVMAMEGELRREEAYLREGHTARTLARQPDLRIVLVVMKAGARIAEHGAGETASVQALRGHVRLRLPDKVVDLPGGRLLVLDKGLRHDVEAVEDSAFLLTLGWHSRS